MPARIFISHSCKDLQPKDGDDPKSKRLTFAGLVRGKIVDSLGDPTPAGLGYKVLLDKARLEPADNWRAKLHGWLGSCHGAVILLSEDSIASEWVRKEATILTWRKSLRPELLVMPVFWEIYAPALSNRTAWAACS